MTTGPGEKAHANKTNYKSNNPDRRNETGMTSAEAFDAEASRVCRPARPSEAHHRLLLIA
jgi:hypothetical protein